MFYFNEGFWGFIMKIMWYFLRVFLECGLIVRIVEKRLLEGI